MELVHLNARGADSPGLIPSSVELPLSDLPDCILKCCLTLRSDLVEV